MSESSPERVDRPVEIFALFFAAWLLLFAWFPTPGRAFVRGVHAEANAVFAGPFAQRSVSYEWVTPEARKDRSDTRMLGWASGDSERRWRAMFSLRRRGYWPLAAWLALTLSTPMTWRRRTRAIAAGAVCLNGFLIAQLAIVAVCAFGASDPTSAERWSGAIRLATAMFNSPIPSYALVFVLWTWLAQPADCLGFERVARLTRRLPALR